MKTNRTITHETKQTKKAVHRNQKRALPFFLSRRQYARCIRVSSLVLGLSFGLLQPRLQDRFQCYHVVVGQG